MGIELETNTLELVTRVSDCYDRWDTGEAALDSEDAKRRGIGRLMVAQAQADLAALDTEIVWRGFSPEDHEEIVRAAYFKAQP